MEFSELGLLNKYMVFEQMSKVTQKNYLFYATHYLKRVKEQKKLLINTQLSDVIEFIDYRNKNTYTGEPLTQNSVNQIKASLRTLYIANGRLDIATGLRGKSVADKIPVTISQESIMRIFETARFFYDKPGKLWKNDLVYFFVSLLYQSGGRIDELMNLVRDDIDFKYATIKLRSKGCEYLRKLNPDWLIDFKRWMNKNHVKTFVFVDPQGRKFPKRSMQWIIGGLTKKALAKEKGYSAHRFRASCITHRLQAGEEFFSVSSNFHKHVNTTRKYLGATARSLNKMINPLDTLKNNRDSQ